MNELRELGLVELHNELMLNLSSGQSKLSAGVRNRIDALGWLTQELLVNIRETYEDGSIRTPLLVACGSGTQSAIDALLRWYAVPTIEEFAYVLTSSMPRRHVIAKQLLKCARRDIIQRVFWLSCQYNEASMAAACLEQGACIDLPLTFHHYPHDAPAIWRDTGPPAPLVYAASQGHLGLVKVLKKYGADLGVSDDEDIGCLILAAFQRHTDVVAYLLPKLDLTAVDRARVYEVLGAAHVIANDTAAGKSCWRKAIAILEAARSYKSRYVAQIKSLNETLGFRTAVELERMRAKEFRVQALIIIERHLGRTRLFIEALLKIPYTIEVSIYTLHVILQSDRLTVENLQKVEEHLDKLGFFKVAEIVKIMDCLGWCIAAVRHLRELVEIHPVNLQDHLRYRTLVKFICQVLLCLERHRDNDLKHTHLHHLLRRIVGVCHPMAHIFSLLHHLMRVRLEQKNAGQNDIFALLRIAGADLVVLDANRNTLLHEAVRARADNLPVTKDLIQGLIHAGVPRDAVNCQGVSVKDTICRFLDCTDLTQCEGSDILACDE